MKRLACVARLILVASVLILPAAAIAQEHGKEGNHAEEEAKIAEELKWKTANFVILAAIIGFVAFRFGGKFFASRTADIQRGLAEAAKLKADAETRYAEMERRLATLDAEIAEMRKHAGEESSAEGKRIREETGREIAKVQAQAQQDLASAAKAVRQQLRVHAAELAIGLAEQKIRQQINAASDGQLVESMVKELGRRAGNQPGRVS